MSKQARSPDQIYFSFAAAYRKAHLHFPTLAIRSSIAPTTTLFLLTEHFTQAIVQLTCRY